MEAKNTKKKKSYFSLQMDEIIKSNYLYGRKGPEANAAVQKIIREIHLHTNVLKTKVQITGRANLLRNSKANVPEVTAPQEPTPETSQPNYSVYSELMRSVDSLDQSEIDFLKLYIEFSLTKRLNRNEPKT